jgi:hypothetical protein
MVKFIDVDPNEVPNFRESRRGRVSYPILKSFLETGKPLVQLDRTGVQQSLQSLSSSLGAYIRNHELPVKLFQRRGEIYLMRTDIDEGGSVSPVGIDSFSRKVDPVGKAPEELLRVADEIPEVDDVEVEARFGVEKNLSTK